MSKIILIKQKDLKSIIVQEGAVIKDVIKRLNKSTRQIALVINKKRKLVGTITDGDIRRGLIQKNINLSSNVKLVTNLRPLTFNNKNKNFKKIKNLMLNQEIHSAPLVDEKHKTIGLLTIRDKSIKKFENMILIMAGGRGLRLMPLTKKLPKPMIRVGGKPVLENIINKAKHEGFTNFTISINYLGKVIESYFGDGKKFGVNITYIKEKKPLGTAGSIKFLINKNKLPFIVMNGDVISDVNLADLIDFHKKQKSFSTVVTQNYYLKHPYGVINTDGFRITKFEEKPSFQANVNTGVYSFNHKAISQAKFKGSLNMIDFLDILKKKQIINAYPIHENWYDIGTHEQLKNIKQLKKDKE
jgi:dTDP-glucose pyrophosphorylase